MRDILAALVNRISFFVYRGVIPSMLDANIILIERIGKWNYYELNDEEVKGLLSEKLCRVFYPNSKAGYF